MNGPVFTIGHSSHAIERFIELLQGHGITEVCDARSMPYSRVYPQFNRETLQQWLRSSGIAYLFLGAELGARPDDASCYAGGKARFERIAETELFRRGIDRVLAETGRHRLALLCAEKDPLECHRAVLVARQLHGMGLAVEHILEDGSLESHEQAVARLLRRLKLPDRDLFRSHEEVVEDAYRVQGERIAYQEHDSSAPRAASEGSAAR